MLVILGTYRNSQTKGQIMGLTFDPPDASGSEQARTERTKGGNSYSAVRLANKTTLIKVAPGAGNDIVVNIPPTSSVDPVAKGIDWGAVADKIVEIADAIGDVIDAVLPDGDGDGGGNGGGKGSNVTINQSGGSITIIM